MLSSIVGSYIKGSVNVSFSGEYHKLDLFTLATTPNPLPSKNRFATLNTEPMDASWFDKCVQFQSQLYC